MNRKPAKIKIRVEEGDALTFHVDVLALKYAQGTYGLDREIFRRFEGAGLNTKTLAPMPDQFEIVGSHGQSVAPAILFVGVKPLRDFRYKDIRRFSRLVLEALTEVAPAARQVGMTLHGANYGLDETEAFEAEIAGLVDAIRDETVPPSLELITIIERKASRARRLKEVLSELIPSGYIQDESKAYLEGQSEGATERLRSAGYTSDSKPHIFVAMPFSEDMEDVYHYGIGGAVREAGFICERADQSSFTGDVLDWVRTRIRTCTLLIADLSGANANVYLEVGYAWGCNIPTVLLIQDADQLKFDVKGQRCLIYKRIKDLEAMLKKELEKLKLENHI